MVEIIGTLGTVNAILLNIKINQPKLVNMYGYKMATNWQNFTETYFAKVKILQNIFFLGGGKGLLFDSRSTHLKQQKFTVSLDCKCFITTVPVHSIVQVHNFASIFDTCHI